MYANLEPQSASNPGCSTTPPKSDEVTLAWESATSCLNTEASSTRKFAARQYLDTPEQIAEELKIDEEGKLWWRKRAKGYRGSSRRQMDKPVGSIAGNGYEMATVNNHKYYSSTLAFCLYYGRWPAVGKVLDHINHNICDNRKENLREVSNAENIRNQIRLATHNTSGVVGVSWHSRDKRWAASLIHNDKRISGGYHKRFEDAVVARRLLEIEYGVDEFSLLTRQLIGDTQQHKTDEKFRKHETLLQSISL